VLSASSNAHLTLAVKTRTLLPLHTQLPIAISIVTSDAAKASSDVVDADCKAQVKKSQGKCGAVFSGADRDITISRGLICSNNLESTTSKRQVDLKLG
jgi:hypothetical protein